MVDGLRWKPGPILPPHHPCAPLRAAVLTPYVALFAHVMYVETLCCAYIISKLLCG